MNLATLVDSSMQRRAHYFLPDHMGGGQDGHGSPWFAANLGMRRSKPVAVHLASCWRSLHLNISRGLACTRKLASIILLIFCRLCSSINFLRCDGVYRCFVFPSVWVVSRSPLLSTKWQRVNPFFSGIWPPCANSAMWVAFRSLPVEQTPVNPSFSGWQSDLLSSIT